MTTPLQHTSLGELGGYTPLLATSLGELSSGILPPVIEESGSAWDPTDPGQRERRDFYRKQIMEEDDEILALIQAFIQVLDD